MTMTVLDRALVAGDAGRVTGERRSARIRRCPSGPAGGRSPRSTSWTWWPSTTRRPTGEKGAVLRREGLYSSHVIEWRRARDAGALAGPARPRGRPAADPRDAQIARLQKEKAKLEQELAKARFVVDVQSKLQALLETISESADTEPGSKLVTDEAIAVLAPRIGTRAACAAVGRAAGHLVPAAPDQPAAAEAGPGPARGPGPAAGAGPGRAARRSWTRCTATGSLTWPRPRSGPPAGRGHLPRLGVHLLPGAARGRREPGTPRAGHPPRRGQARAGRPPARTRSTPGTSPSCTARRSGPTTTST